MKTSFTKEDTLIVKGVAIITMLLHHCFICKTNLDYYQLSYAPFDKTTVLNIAKWSKVCVGIFVFLSAYGITLSLKKLQKNKQFQNNQITFSTMRRIWRILAGFWPIYLFSVVGSLIWSREKFAVYKSGFSRILYVALDFLGLSDLLGTPSLIGTWWYLGLAILEILALPCLYVFYRKYGALILIGLSYLLPFALKLGMPAFIRWLPAMTLGIVFADQDVFGRIQKFGLSHIRKEVLRCAEFIILLFLLLVSYKLRFTTFGEKHLNIVDSLTPLLVILFVFLFVCQIPVLSSFLKLLGTHSMNIFLFHSFVRGRWFVDFTYSFRHWWLIVLVLVLDCLLISMMIEKIKKLVHYESFVMKVESTLKEHITP